MSAAKQGSSGQSSGPSTDSSNTPVVDPTDNVLRAVDAASRRQDDLREANNKWIMSEIDHLKDMLHSQAECAKELSAKESSRVDSIRMVDEVTKTAAQAQNSLAISTLAKQTTDIATTLSTQVQTTAQAAEARRLADNAEVIKRVSALELALSASAGKSTMADPALVELTAAVRTMMTKDSTRTGFDAGKAAAIAGGLAAATALGGGGVALLLQMMR